MQPGWERRDSRPSVAGPLRCAAAAHSLTEGPPARREAAPGARPRAARHLQGGPSAAAPRRSPRCLSPPPPPARGGPAGTFQIADPLLSSPPGAPRPRPRICCVSPVPSPRRGAACAASPPHGPARRRASPPRTAASRPPRSGRRIWDPRRAPRCPAAAAPAPRTPGLRLRLLPPGPAPVSLRRPPPTSGARGIASGPKAEPERPNPVQGGKETCAPPGMERTAHGGRQRPPADWRSLRRSRAPSVVLAFCFTEISPNSDPSPSALRQGNEPGLPRLGQRTETRRGLRPPQDFIQMALIQKWHKSTTVHPVSPHPRGKGSPEPTGTSVSYSVHHMVDSHWR